MVIEEIINELDKFITKYKERKDGAEKGISLRNNIKQALTEKGIQGADMLDDSAIVERIKTLPSRDNTDVEETQNNNSINETFAQQVIQILKENHIPFLNSKEDNIEELKKWTQKVNTVIGNKQVYPDIKYVDGKTMVKIKPTEYFGVKVDCVCDSGTVNETILAEKEYTGVTSMSIQPVDYYGAKDSNIGKRTLNFEFLEKMGSLDKLQVQYTEGSNNDILFTSIVDSNDYNIFDERMKKLYFALIEQKANSIKGSKEFNPESIPDAVETYKITGNIKLLILDKQQIDSSYDENNFFGFGYLRGGTILESKPKYIAVINPDLKWGQNNKNSNINFEDIGDTEEWNQRVEKANKTKTIIYRWDSTQGKYMFESAETLEEWLKTHPIETL
jgi:hypothetical protein